MSPKEMQKNLDWLDSPEGQKSLEDYANKIVNREKILDSQLQRAFDKYGYNLDEIVEKIIAKYNSKTYIDKEYKIGREPMENLYYFFYSYAEKYGREVTESQIKEYGNTFTAGMVVVGNWILNLMHGQGTAIQIYKIN